MQWKLKEIPNKKEGLEREEKDMELELKGMKDMRLEKTEEMMMNTQHQLQKMKEMMTNMQQQLQEMNDV